VCARGRPPGTNLRLGAPQRVGARGARPRIDAQPGSAARPQAGGLASVHSRHANARGSVERRLAREQELAVEDRTGGAGHEACRRGVQTDAPMHPHRRPERGDALLEQHERAVVAHPAAGLAALGDDRIGARGLRGARGLEAARDDEGQRSVCADRCHRIGEPLVRAPAERDDVEGRRHPQHLAEQVGAGVHEDSPAPPPVLGEPVESAGGQHRAGRELQIDDAERTGPRPGDRQRGVRASRGGDDCDVEADHGFTVIQHRRLNGHELHPGGLCQSARFSQRVHSKSRLGSLNLRHAEYRSVTCLAGAETAP
jgi:hypothetical protein